MRHSIHSIVVRGWRAVFFALLVFGLLATYMLPAASVWATPNQSPLRQTVPTLTPTPVPSWIWIGRAEGEPADYAPSGVPDFDQKQGDWNAPGQPELWTHCGPVAIADALWWLDSRYEPDSTEPPAVEDGHGLVISLDGWDDHDAQNTVPLVNELAYRLDTNGARTGGDHLGTDVSLLAPALEAYLADQGVQDDYGVTMVVSPAFDQLLAWVRRGDGIILLLGLWEDQGDRWVYLGSRYVAVAGAEPQNRFVAISDPFLDAFESGRVELGRSPSSHAYPHAGNIHNNARFVSQDAYPAVAAQGPGGVWALGSYARSYEEVEGSVGQNRVAGFDVYESYYLGGQIATKADFAVVLSHRTYTMCLPVLLKGAR